MKLKQWSSKYSVVRSREHGFELKRHSKMNDFCLFLFNANGAIQTRRDLCWGVAQNWWSSGSQITCNNHGMGNSCSTARNIDSDFPFIFIENVFFYTKYSVPSHSHSTAGRLAECCLLEAFFVFVCLSPKIHFVEVYNYIVIWRVYSKDHTSALRIENTSG